MPSILTISQIISLGRVSIYLSANYTDRGNLFGGTLMMPVPPVQIAMVTEALEWGNASGAETDASLRQVANYLYWMCGKFQLQAQRITNLPGGGSVTPTPASATSPNAYDWEVTADSTPLADGESEVTLTEFIGYNIEFTRGGLTQNTTNIGGSYYTWNKSTGKFTCSPAATLTELFRICPV